MSQDLRSGSRVIAWRICQGSGFSRRCATFVGAGSVVAGLLVSFAGAGVFRRLGTAIIPYKPATRLVTSGIYRWTRNPMYLGMALIYLGVTTFFNSLSSLVLLPLVIATVQTQVIARRKPISSGRSAWNI